MTQATAAQNAPAPDAAQNAPAPEWRPARTEEKRSVWQAMKRGVMGRCPKCGEGKLYYKYLKVNPNCSVCGEDLSQHRADDAPPYVVITIVGHVVIFGIMLVEEHAENFSYLTHLMIWPPIALAMSLALLPGVKGALIGMQWALRMHGFGDDPKDKDA